MSLIACPRCTGSNIAEAVEARKDCSTAPPLPPRTSCSFCVGSGLVNIEEAAIRCPHCGEEIGVIASGRW